MESISPAAAHCDYPASELRAPWARGAFRVCDYTASELDSTGSLFTQGFHGL